MRYYVAVYSHNLKWWTKGATVYDSFDEAYAARCAVINEVPQHFHIWSDIRQSWTTGDKCAVFTKLAWDRLDCGYKSPEQRSYKETHPKDKGEVSTIKEFERVETAMGVALKGAGL